MPRDPGNPISDRDLGTSASFDYDFEETKIQIQDLSVSYSDGTESLQAITLDIPANQITVLFGPAGGGKSTLLRTINRLNDLADVVSLNGKVLIDNIDILDPDLDVIELRRR
ncbi:MAG: ATP-binding cassette domain-containing protein, partial [Anaerolineales bacterium]